MTKQSLSELNRAVLRQLGGNHDDARAAAIDAAKHGADSGFGGFTYTRDCVRFYQRNKAAIFQRLHELADDMGETPGKVLAGFRCLKDVPDPMAALAIGPKHEDYDRVANALAWFALEECGHELEAEDE